MKKEIKDALKDLGDWDVDTMQNPMVSKVKETGAFITVKELVKELLKEIRMLKKRDKYKRSSSIVGVVQFSGDIPQGDDKTLVELEKDIMALKYSITTVINEGVRNLETKYPELDVVVSLKKEVICFPGCKELVTYFAYVETKITDAQTT